MKGHSLENECHAAFSNLETSDRGHELIRRMFTEVVNHASGPLFAASEVSPCWPLKRIQALPLTQCQTFVYSLFCMENIIYACEKLCVEVNHSFALLPQNKAEKAILPPYTSTTHVQFDNITATIAAHTRVLTLSASHQST